MNFKAIVEYINEDGNPAIATKVFDNLDELFADVKEFIGLFPDQFILVGIAKSD